jgi:hypothetical protein
MNDAQFDQLLKQQIDELPSEIKPERDLWAGIDHAIEQKQDKGRFNIPKLSAMAAGLAVLGLTGYLTFNQMELPQAHSAGDGLQYVTLMTESFEQRKQALLVKYEDTQPATDNWRQQLKELDEAAVAIKKVLDEDPTNAQLIKMLQQTYQQQLDLIKAVNHNPWQTI